MCRIELCSYTERTPSYLFGSQDESQNEIYVAVAISRPECASSFAHSRWICNITPREKHRTLQSYFRCVRFVVEQHLCHVYFKRPIQRHRMNYAVDLDFRSLYNSDYQEFTAARKDPSPSVRTLGLCTAQSKDSRLDVGGRQDTAAVHWSYPVGRVLLRSICWPRRKTVPRRPPRSAGVGVSPVGGWIVSAVLSGLYWYWKKPSGNSVRIVCHELTAVNVIHFSEIYWMGSPYTTRFGPERTPQLPLRAEGVCSSREADASVLSMECQRPRNEHFSWVFPVSGESFRWVSWKISRNLLIFIFVHISCCHRET